MMGTAAIKAKELRELGGSSREERAGTSREAVDEMAALGYELAGEVLRDVEQARCEGYANYATSSVALTLENDRAMSEGLRALLDSVRESAPASEEVREGTWSVEEATRFILADALKDYVERLMEPGVKDGDVGLVASALVRAGFGEVDWEDLARVELARADES